MHTTEQFCQPFVSIQKPGSADADTGHAAWGALISGMMVVCRDTDWVEYADPSWEALLATSPVDGTGSVERIHLQEIDVLGAPGDEGTVVLVKLTHAPAHAVRTSVDIEDFDEDVFIGALGDGYDVGHALEAVQLLPPGWPPSGSVASVLGPVDHWKTVQQPLLVRRYDPRNPGPSRDGPAAAHGRQEPEGPGAEADESPPADATDTGTGNLPPSPQRLLICFFKRCR